MIVGQMLWHIVDVRDVAKLHRLCVESPIIRSGSRYIAGPIDETGELLTWQLQAALLKEFPDRQIGGERMGADGKPEKETEETPHGFMTLAQEELGITPIPCRETLKDTVQSLISLGIVTSSRKSPAERR